MKNINGNEAYVITLADGQTVFTTKNQEEMLLNHYTGFTSQKISFSKTMVWHNLIIWRNLMNFGIEEYAETILVNINAVVSVALITEKNIVNY